MTGSRRHKREDTLLSVAGLAQISGPAGLKTTESQHRKKTTVVLFPTVNYSLGKGRDDVYNHRVQRRSKSTDVF